MAVPAIPKSKPAPDQHILALRLGGHITQHHGPNGAEDCPESKALLVLEDRPFEVWLNLLPIHLKCHSVNVSKTEVVHQQDSG